MRILKFLSFSAALLAVGMSVSSCSSSDDPVDGGSGSATVTAIHGAKYSVVATSNESVKYSIDAAAISDVSSDGKKVVFSDIDVSSVEVTAEYTGADAAEYVNAKQTATVDLSNKTTSASLDFVFVKKSESVAQSTAIGGAPVMNTDQSVTVASITVPAGVTVSGSTEGFAITAYKIPADVANTEDFTAGKVFNVGGYVLNCQPDGATFSSPVTLKVFVGAGLAGMKLTLKNGNETVDGTVASDGTVSFAVNHFSEWYLTLPFKVVDDPKTSNDLIQSLTVNAVNGENSFSYTKKVGFDINLVEGNAENFQFAVDMVKGVLGDLSSSLEEKASFTVVGSGVAGISVFQTKRVYKLSYENDYVFNVTRYEDIAYEITISGVTHSGGNGK